MDKREINMLTLEGKELVDISQNEPKQKNVFTI